jgi:tetratricopeptide (TPR) repeat protein
MRSGFDEEELFDMLYELEELDPEGWLGRALLELALDQLVGAGETRSEVGLALVELVRNELRYRHQLEAMVASPKLELGTLRSLYDEYRAALEQNLDQLTHALATSNPQRAARALALAGCQINLGHVEEALACAEGALEAGVNEALLHLVLGALRYQEVLRRFGPRRQLGEREALRFQLACLWVVSALEKGLGGELDSQLYWWIGTVLESAGFEQAAREAYAKAQAAEVDDEEGQEDEEEEDWQEGDTGVAPAGSSGWAEDQPGGLPAISAVEEELVREALKYPRYVRELLDAARDGQ